jgi:hypothetical protein
MIGYFGVAPAMGQAFSPSLARRTAATWTIGCLRRGRRPGFRSVRGALFYLGDGHVCQGDGELIPQTVFSERRKLGIVLGPRIALARCGGRCCGGGCEQVTAKYAPAVLAGRDDKAQRNPHARLRLLIYHSSHT